MKKILLPFILLFLVNCYSYRNPTVENSSAQTNPSKIYEITLINKDKIIARNLRLEENNNYIYTDQRNLKKNIPKDQIFSMKEREFSWIKTSGLAVASVAAAYFIGGIAVTNSNFLE